MFWVLRESILLFCWTEEQLRYVSDNGLKMASIVKGHSRTRCKVYKAKVYILHRLHQTGSSEKYTEWNPIRVRLPEPGHLEEHCPITTILFLKTKDSQVFCKWTKNINYKFDGCFPRGQVSSNSFKVFNRCIV